MSAVKRYIKENMRVLIVFAALSVIECAVVLPMMMEDYINYDSSYQYALTQHSLSGIMELLPYDYSPPFYAVALKLWTLAFGNSLTVMRSFSALAAVGMLFVGAFPVNSVFGKRSAVICMAVIFCSGPLLKNLHEIRPTIFGMFFMMAVAAYALAAFSRGGKGNYIAFTVFSVLAMYTHNISLVGTFAVFAVLLIFLLAARNFKKFRNILICGIVCIIAYIPWLKVIFSQIDAVKNDYWDAILGFNDMLEYIFMAVFMPYFHSDHNGLIQGMFMSLAMTGAALALLRHIKLKELKTAQSFREIINIPGDKALYKNILLCALFIFVTVVILELVNIFLRNLTSERYCYIIGTVWIILLSALLGSLGSRIYNVIFSVILLGYGCVNIYHVKADLRYADMTEIKDYFSNIACIDEADISFFHAHEWTLGTMAYYFPEATHYVCDDTFTVLRTLDVFPVNVVEIGDVENIRNYTDSCYIFTGETIFNNKMELYSSNDLLNRVEEVKITPIKKYTMGYAVVKPDFDLALAEFGEASAPETGEE